MTPTIWRQADRIIIEHGDEVIDIESDIQTDTSLHTLTVGSKRIDILTPGRFVAARIFVTDGITELAFVPPRTDEPITRIDYENDDIDNNNDNIRVFSSSRDRD